MKRPEVVLNGNDLTIDDVVAIGVGDKAVALDAAALDRCRRSRAFLEQEVAARRIIYGVNTSFGPMCNKIIADDDLGDLQVNLIRSHAAGLGDPLKYYIAQAVMAVRLNTLVKGYSGVRVTLLELMRDMINAGIAPYIPECGSVGASGDLVHLAHLALAIIGEGAVFHKGQLTTAGEALKAEGLTPFRLSFKEGLALINGTSAMTALAAFALFGARKLLSLSSVTAAFALEIFGGIDDAFDEDLHRVKPHPGQQRIAETIRRLYQGSRNITRRSEIHDRIRQGKAEGVSFETDINVQDVYSIRCTPQILAPVQETIEQATVPPLVSMWPIQNATTQHIDDQLAALLSTIETYLVNSRQVGVVSRERQAELVRELRLRQSDIYDPVTAGKLGRQLGARYFVTGTMSSVDERLKDTHRVQYSLILQVIEVETGLIRFQNEAIRSKALSR